jgi:hypothetical protein
MVFQKLFGNIPPPTLSPQPKASQFRCNPALFSTEHHFAKNLSDE